MTRSFSFEFFPPKDEPGIQQLQAAARDLSRLNTTLMTLTYGAGGSSRDGTLRAIRALRQAWSGAIAAHLTYAGQRADDLLRFADHLWTEGVADIVALRGDLNHPLLPLEDPPFTHTHEFVAALRERHPFTVHVGTYPEKHPDSADLTQDIAALKAKQDAGAADALTQFFYETNLYTNFAEKAHAAGVTIPIIPGLLPLYDFQKTKNFAARCGAHIPESLRAEFEPPAPPEQIAAKAANLLRKQMKELESRDITRFHIYTLNRADVILQALKDLP